MTDTFDIEQAERDEWKVEWRRNKLEPWTPGEFGIKRIGRNGHITYRVYCGGKDYVIDGCNIRNLPPAAPAEHVVAVSLNTREAWACEPHDQFFEADSGIWADDKLYPTLISRTELTFDGDGKVVKQDGVELVQAQTDFLLRVSQLEADLAAAQAELESSRAEAENYLRPALCRAEEQLDDLTALLERAGRAGVKIGLQRYGNHTGSWYITTGNVYAGKDVYWCSDSAKWASTASVLHGGYYTSFAAALAALPAALDAAKGGG